MLLVSTKRPKISIITETIWFLVADHLKDSRDTYPAVEYQALPIWLSIWHLLTRSIVEHLYPEDTLHFTADTPAFFYSASTDFFTTHSLYFPFHI